MVIKNSEVNSRSSEVKVKHACITGKCNDCEHVLQICNIQQPERIAQWASATPLHQKIYGGLEDLKKTTNVITAVGLVV